jgi:opacity protein-like surface antigen
MKNFKAITVSISVLFSIFLSAQTEKGFYASVNSGYNIGTGNVDYYQANVLGIINSNESSASVSSSELVRVNLGKGLNAGINFGYMFNKNIGFELGGNYLLGGKINGSYTSYTGDYLNSEVSAKMLQIKPSLVFRSDLDKFNPYAKVGMIIGSGKIINTTVEKDGADLETRTLELDGGMPIGFQASIGTLYKLNEKLSIFGELNLVNLNYAPKKGHITEATLNGINQLPTYTISDKEIEFTSSFTNTGAPLNPNAPSKSPTLDFSFSSFGLNVGLLYQFK